MTVERWLQLALKIDLKIVFMIILGSLAYVSIRENIFTKVHALSCHCENSESQRY